MAALPDRLAAALADRYRVERELGQGGMATVYLAQDLKHDRKVAVKVLRPELAAVIGAERFLSEIKTTANLQHPHILPLFDSGEAGGFLYYVMPFVEGETLRSKLDREKQLGVEEAVRLTREVAEALEHAHRHGVVHRDVKPENILLDSGHAMVTDFGIAKAIDAAGGKKLTATGLAIGTPLYMSPEQSLGDASVDGRSDLYSLGTVLFELLAGEAPFSGASAQAIITKRMTLPVPSVRVLRETVPESVDAVLSRALAKAPADRFATVAEFGEALGGGDIPARRGSIRSTPAARWVGFGVALLVVLAAAIGIRWPWRRPSASLEPNLLAVIPFDVSDPALAVWGEGVVDFLSRTLDGAGNLRSVAPSLIVSGWSGRSDRASATAVARRLGAGLAITGDLSRRGLDSVDIRGVLLDIARGSVLGEVTVSGPEDRVGQLVDTLGIALLDALARDRPVAAVRRSALGVAPLPALKAFLRGEQLYRRSLYDSALSAYAETIARDSMFAFAYYRMKLVLGWNPVTAGEYDTFEAYRAKAHLKNHGLSGRDSLIIAADSLLANGSAARPDMARLGFARLDQLVQAYPRDPEAWYELGDALMHADPGLGGDEPRALAAFDRAVALDSGFVPPWEHLLQLVLKYRGVDEARRYALTFSAYPTPTSATMSTKLASRLLLDTTGGRDPDLQFALHSAATVTLYRLVVEYFVALPDSAETAITLARLLDARQVGAAEGEDAPWVYDSLMRHQYLAFALMTRGHLHEAARVDHRLLTDRGASPWSFFADPYLTLALYGAIPAAHADSTFRVALKPWGAGGLPADRELSGLPWWAARRDTMAIRLFGQRMREAASRTELPSERAAARYLEAASSAFMALSRGDSASALALFDAMPSCMLINRALACSAMRLTHASILGARGADLQAAALDSLLPVATGVVMVLARLERAEVARQLRDREAARRDYRFVLDAWRGADTELAPYVERAQSGLALVEIEP